MEVITAKLSDGLYHNIPSEYLFKREDYYIKTYLNPWFESLEKEPKQETIFRFDPRELVNG